jgi:hypothetical protein
MLLTSGNIMQLISGPGDVNSFQELHFSEGPNMDGCRRPGTATMSDVCVGDLVKVLLVDKSQHIHPRSTGVHAIVYLVYIAKQKCTIHHIPDLHSNRADVSATVII